MQNLDNDSEFIANFLNTDTPQFTVKCPRLINWIHMMRDINGRVRVCASPGPRMVSILRIYLDP